MKHEPAPNNDVSSSRLTTTDCEACRNPSSGLYEFAPFIGMKPVLAKGIKILAPYYGAGMMLCYPCYKKAVKIDIKKPFNL